VIRRIVVTTALIAPLLLAAPAHATRFAASGGSASDPVCAAASPCTLQQALAVSSSGEEILVAQGDYAVSAPSAVPCSGPFDPVNPAGAGIYGSNRFIHGVAGRPRPRIIADAASCVGLIVADAGSASHLEVLGSNTTSPEAYALLIDGGGNANDIVTGGANGAVHMRNGARLLGSVIRSRPQDGASILSHFGSGVASSFVTNVTALGLMIADSVPINGLSDTVEIACLNSIATVGFLARVTNPVAGSFANVNRNHCAGPALPPVGVNANTPDQGGNVAPAMLLPGDYHQVLGSPTIDAGVLVAAIVQIPIDIDGGQRTVGPLPDIGADEAGGALAIVDSGAGAPSGANAVVNGSVIPGGVPTDAYVAYGPTTGYGGQSAALAAGAGFGAVALSFTLTGLTANAPYHYAIVGTNGNVVGEDRVIAFPDADGDGFFANADCNDANAAIRPGAAEILGNAVDENCDGAAPPKAPVPSIGVTIGWSVEFVGTRTRVKSLDIRPAVAGSTVKLTCKSPKKASRSARCPFKTKTVKVKKKAGKLALVKQFKKRRLAIGTTFDVRVTKPGTIGAVRTFVTRKRKLPTTRLLCLQPGASKPAKC
jgi:hypothetical protein